MLYMVQYDGEPEYVEAPDYGCAIVVWRKKLLDEWREDGCYKPDDDNVQPEQVMLVHEGPVLR